MLLKNLSLLFLISLLFSCSPQINSNFTKSYPELSITDTIKIFDVDSYARRDNSKEELLGYISVRDGGTTTNCSYDKMMQIVKDSARANGGNIIGLKQHLEPKLFGSSCHQFDADILKSNTNKIDSLGKPFSSNVSSEYYVDTFEKEILKNRFAISLQTGIAFRIGINNNGEEFSKKYTNSVKNGAALSVLALYKLKKTFYLGIKYSYFHYGGSFDGFQREYNDGRPTEYGLYKVDQYNHYIGISSTSVHSFGNNKNEIITGSSIGYVSFEENEGFTTIHNYKGASLGLDFNLGYQRLFSEKFSMGVNFGLFLGTISDITYSNGNYTESYILDKDNRIGLNNINTMLHFRYVF